MTHINQFASRYVALALVAFVLAFSASFMLVHADSGSGRGVGVFIGTNGNAHVSGATVTATSTTGLTATTNLGGNAITWNVLASSTTRFGKLGVGLSALANVAIGDIVSFFGRFSGSGSSLTVGAQVIKDHTKQGTTTPGKVRGIEGKIGARFEHFLDVHNGLKARMQDRIRVGGGDN